MAIDVDFYDYKEVKGIKFPHSFTMPMGPMKMEVNADEIMSLFVLFASVHQSTTGCALADA